MAAEVKLRLYCHGLGDCLLVTLTRADGEPFNILIDCGIHSSSAGGKDRIREAVEDILSVAPRLDVVVGTHEHWDHISGFSQAEDIFARFDVGQVWFGWTENPADRQASALDRFKGTALSALGGAAVALAGPRGDGAAAERLDSLLGFMMGVAGERSRGAREKLRALSSDVRYLEPGALAPLPRGLEAYRIHVLGPPRDPRMLGLMDSKAETYSLSPATANLIDGLSNALAVNAGTLSLNADPLAPFDDSVGLPLSAMLDAGPVEADPDAAFLWTRYAGQDDWRRVDADWLGAASTLALQLDSRTNNSSLVLAIELVDSGKVLLFAADAQVGNWKTWAGLRLTGTGPEGPVTGADLLARTVFYKVGHHGSRNATLGPGGLELMVHEELSAFIPTDEVMAKKVGWSDIPADKLLDRLRTLTRGRIVQSDSDWLHQRDTRPAEGGGWFDGLTLNPARDQGRTLSVEWTVSG